MKARTHAWCEPSPWCRDLVAWFSTGSVVVEARSDLAAHRAENPKNDADDGQNRSDRVQDSHIQQQGKQYEYNSENYQGSSLVDCLTQPLPVFPDG